MCQLVGIVAIDHFVAIGFGVVGFFGCFFEAVRSRLDRVKKYYRACSKGRWSFGD